MQVVDWDTVPAQCIRELLKLATLLMVCSLELVMLHPQSLLLQHDLLVQAVQMRALPLSSIPHSQWEYECMFLMGLTPAAL